eukprot:gene9018-18385_t
MALADIALATGSEVSFAIGCLLATLAIVSTYLVPPTGCWLPSPGRPSPSSAAASVWTVLARPIPRRNRTTSVVLFTVAYMMFGTVMLAFERANREFKRMGTMANAP